MPVIYAIRNKTTNQVYVGCTKGKLSKRLREHKCMLNKRIHTSAAMQADYDIGGWDVFEGYVLEHLPEDANVVQKRTAELYWMQQFEGNLYNFSQASFAPTKEAIKKGVAEARKTASERMKKQWQDPEMRAKRLAGIQTPESREYHRERLLKQWQEPEFRSARINGMNIGREKTNAARKIK